MRAIEGVSHLVIATPDPVGAASDYARLLGTAARPVRDLDGRPGRWFETANLSVLLREPTREEAAGLASLVFRVADLAAAREGFIRCGISVGDILDQVWTGDAGDTSLRWREATTDRTATHGLAIALTDRLASGVGTGVGLDHVVVRTPDPERAIALFGGRLGLDMRLDRANPAWNARLLFFRCGDLVVEIVHSLSEGVSNAPDAFGGLSWRVPDIDAIHARLTGDGLSVSPVRTGRRPGSRVFTLREGTARVPTILLGVEPRA